VPPEVLQRQPPPFTGSYAIEDVLHLVLLKTLKDRGYDDPEACLVENNVAFFASICDRLTGSPGKQVLLPFCVSVHVSSITSKITQ
jgi:hypothetical protein